MLESVSDPGTKHDAHAWFLLEKKKKSNNSIFSFFLAAFLSGFQQMQSLYFKQFDFG